MQHKFCRLTPQFSFINQDTIFKNEDNSEYFTYYSVNLSHINDFSCKKE